MTETPSSSEPATTPVATTGPVAPPPVVETNRQPSRLLQTAAWVGITAGVVFIVAVVFGMGFFLGAHSGGHRGGGFHDRPGIMMFHRGGPPMGPGQGMFGPGGPDFGGPGGFRPPVERPGAPTPPPTTAPARP